MTIVHSYGKGKPIYIVNGGPGLDCSYLKDFFMPLARNMEIVFYDQIGTGDDFDINIHVTAPELVQQLVELLGNDKRRKSLIAHSWGSYLVLAALLGTGDDLGVDKVILINPFAVDYARYRLSGRRLLSRFPESILAQFEKLAKEGSNESYTKMMYLIAPYYTHQPGKKYNFYFSAYNGRMENSVYDSISGFNHVPLLLKLKSDLYLIKCEDDFISLEDTAELQEIAKKYTIIPNCGHFPFVEQKKRCYHELTNFLDADLEDEFCIE